MELKIEGNINYVTTVVKIKKLIQLEGLDNLLGVNIFGFNCLVSKDIKEGDLMLLITAETKINSEFLSANNLFASAEMNFDKLKKGYMAKNCRVRAIKMRGHISSGLLLPISSLAYFISDYAKLKEGDTFDTINGNKFCEKFEIAKKMSLNGQTKDVTEKDMRIDKKSFPEHFDTMQFLRNEDLYKDTDYITVTQKIHGTSFAVGNLKVKVKQTWWDKILKRQRYEYDYLARSRRVIKDLKAGKNFQHYYKEEGLDIYNRALRVLQDSIPKDTMLYGEIVGYVGGESPIQKGYTYDKLPGTFDIYIYRIVNINPDGITIDYSFDAVKEFCRNAGIKYVPVLWEGFKKDFNPEDFLDKNYTYEGNFKEIPVFLDKGIVDEGVCIRKEGITPLVTKLKSPLFFLYETNLLDEGSEIIS